MNRTASACLTILLLLPMLVFSTPVSHAAEATEAERQEALERLQLLKKQLLELKDELAKVKAEKAREAAAVVVSSDDPAWMALPGLDQHPQNYGLYAYVLVTDQTSQQDAIAVLTLLETGPGSQADKTINSTIFLIPAADKDGRIMIENYKQVLSNRLLKSSGLTDATGPVLLLTIDPFIDNMPEHAMGIDLGGLKAAEIKTVLAGLLQQQDREADDQLRFRQLAWQLADNLSQKRTLISTKDSRLRISWNR